MFMQYFWLGMTSGEWCIDIKVSDILNDIDINIRI
jgi:hypothetical protein